MQYDNTNSGALFKNAKEKETQPDYRGTINVNGTDFWLSAWIKASKKGDKYMSLSVQPKEGQTAKTPPPSGKAIASVPADFQDDIPFN